MPRHRLYIVFAFTWVTLAGFTRITASQVESVNPQFSPGSPFELIDAVNALRASYGLAPYNVSWILMYTAQAQADFMAETEDVTHTGPNGIGFTDRLLAAGYPLAGDLTAGGFRAENIASGNESSFAQSVVDSWTGDALHLNTMISPNLSEIGAGVAIADGKVYYVIDCALPLANGLPESSTALSPEGQISVPIVSTPNSEGDVIHQVQTGESLWQIAMVYKVTIDDVKRLNNLFDNTIYPGDRLLIKTDVVLPAASLTEATARELIVTSTGVPVSPTPNLLPTVTIIYDTPAVASFRDTSVIGIALGIVALTLLVGGVFAWLSRKKKIGN